MSNGITLVALIITIIILIILAAVTIFAFRDSKLIEVAINGTTNYANAQAVEESIMLELSDRLDKELEKIESAQGGKGEQEEGGNEGTTEGKLTVEAAKQIINGSNLKDYLGEEVEYTPEAGGTWRVFYYDEMGYFGTAKTLYLKRDYDDRTEKLISILSDTPTEETMEIMRKMNPLWADSPLSMDKLNHNELAITYLCDQTLWSEFLTGDASFVVGGPSVEMFMRSYNICVGKTNALVCKMGSAYGYLVGYNDIFSGSGCSTPASSMDVSLANGMYGGQWGTWFVSPADHLYVDLVYAERWWRIEFQFVYLG